MEGPGLPPFPPSAVGSMSAGGNGEGGVLCHLPNKSDGAGAHGLTCRVHVTCRIKVTEPVHMNSPAECMSPAESMREPVRMDSPAEYK